MRYTPEKIESLGTHEVFVFGSNLAGCHGRGAARLAYDKFGATWGKGGGFSGKSFAIPTKDGRLRTLPLLSIDAAVAQFVWFASDYVTLTFLVTPIGCGLAGYSPADIAPLFFRHYRDGVPDNVVLPKRFYDAFTK